MHQIHHITCEHMINPLAVTVRKPRFSWELTADNANIYQSAYQITVRKEGGKKVWDSGHVESNRTVDIEYEGIPLESVSCYCYIVMVWDQNQNVQQSEKQYFETAFFEREDWKARWIEPDPLPQLEENPLISAAEEWQQVLEAMMRGENHEIIGDDENMQRRPLEPYDPPVRMRAQFKLKKHAKRIRLYATAHGIYEVKINGMAITDAVLMPGFTTYDKRIKYQVFDIGKMLKEGENGIAAVVADGWYKGKIALGRGCEYGEVPGLLMQINIEYADGTMEYVCTDESWKYSFDGPIRMADLFLGELEDARKNDGEPSCVTYDDREWKSVCVKRGADDNLEAQCEPLVKVFARIPAQRLWNAPNGDVLVDFGQNMAGVICVSLTGECGECITFEHGEVLDQAGNFTYAFERDETRAQRDTYICAGTGTEIFAPRFTYHGFRYVRVTGGESWKKEQFTALAIGTDNPVIGSFRCSDRQLNQLQHNIHWSQRTNNVTIPTDCPTREKAGWTGDVVVYGATALYNQDMTAFYEDWLKTIRMEQMDNGHVRNTAPLIKNYIQQTMAGSLGWGDVILTLPLQLYQLRGDRRVLEENYPAMERWMTAMRKSAYELPIGNPLGGITAAQFAAMTERQQENQHYLINTGFHFGDWLVPSIKNEQGFSDGPMSSFLTMNCVDTSLLAADADMFVRISELLGEHEKAEEYRQYGARVRAAFYEEYVEENGRLCQDMQGNYVLALKFHMVPDAAEPLLAERLAELIHENNDCLDAGFMTIPYLLDVLCDYGYEDTAWRLLWQKQCPSWLYEIERGATTLWESWDAIREDGTVAACSFNHYAFGCVGDFMYRQLLGIWNTGIGYDKIRIAPQYACGLEWAEGSYSSVRGEIKVRWEKSGAGYQIEVENPPNTAAVLVLPDGTEKELGNGRHMVIK